MNFENDLSTLCSSTPVEIDSTNLFPSSSTFFDVAVCCSASAARMAIAGFSDLVVFDKAVIAGLMMVFDDEAVIAGLMAFGDVPITGLLLVVAGLDCFRSVLFRRSIIFRITFFYVSAQRTELPVVCTASLRCTAP